MNERPQVTMRVTPGMIPGLLEVFDEAIAQLNYVVVDFRREARIDRPWMSDPVSVEAARRFTAHAVDGPESCLAKMQLYMDELIKVRDGLRQMQDAYAATEEANRESFRHL